MGHARSLVATFAILIASTSLADDAVQIPLKGIWALNMPGTRDIRELGRSDGTDRDKSLADRIVRSQKYRSEGVKSGFAVTGSDLDALKQVYRVFAKDGSSPTFLSANNSVSLVFFSQEFNCYVHLQKIERKDKQITITYSFVPHLTKELTAHMALIPLGKLSVGEWHVEIVQLPMTEKDRKAGFNSISAKIASKVISQSFTFDVAAPDE